jgi:hypothetical protein
MFLHSGFQPPAIPPEMTQWGHAGIPGDTPCKNDGLCRKNPLDHAYGAAEDGLVQGNRTKTQDLIILHFCNNGVPHIAQLKHHNSILLYISKAPHKFSKRFQLVANPFCFCSSLARKVL